MNPSSLTAGNEADVWEIFDRLLDDLAQAAKSDVAPESFLFDLLRRSVDALSALGGVYWERHTTGVVRRAHYAAPGIAAGDLNPLAEVPEPQHRRILDWTAEQPAPFDFPARGVVHASTTPANPFDAVLLLAPVVVDRQAIGVLEIVHRADVSPDARHGALRILAVLADSIADYQRERQRRSWQDRAASAEQYDRLLAALYDDLDSAAVAYAAANEGRRWSECDRVDLIVYRGKAPRVAAVSGVDVVDRRSDQVRYLELLADVVVQDGEPLWYSNRGAPPSSPRTAQALSEYVDHADVTSVVVLPLFENRVEERSPAGAAAAASLRQTPLAAVVFERFASSIEDDGNVGRERLELFASHVRRALLRSRECESIPLGGWWRRQYRNRSLLARRSARWALVAAAVIAVVGALFIIPSDATVEVRGRLEPQDRREIFAPTDGVVVDVAVDHGQTVKAEDVLVVLRRPELNVELNRVAGELQVAERRLAALRAARTFENPTDANAQIRAQERTAEEEQLKESVRALNDEQRLLLDQVNDLTIRAPIAGTVTTWDVRQVLAGRPVARGQALLNLADVGGPWCVEVLIPERYVGDVTAARRGQTEPLEVEFVAATDPAKKYRGRVLHVAESTEIDPELGVVVEATVAVDRTAIDPVQLRPGAVVTARIRCGDSSLGSVWTRDLRRYLKSWWW